MRGHIQTSARHRPNIGERPAWQERAACQKVDPELFYPASIEATGRSPEQTLAPARAVCRRCEVRKECLDWALEHREQWGVWGGTTWAERRLMLGRTAGDPTPKPRPEKELEAVDKVADTLVTMHAAGATDRMIAAVAGRNEKTIRARRKKLGLQPQYRLRTMRGRAQVWTHDEEQQLVTMHAAGATGRQIADALNRTPEAVQRKRQRLGLPYIQDTEEEL